MKLSEQVLFYGEGFQLPLPSQGGEILENLSIFSYFLFLEGLTHWSRVMHIYVSVNYDIIGSNTGLLPFRCDTIICTRAGLLTEPLGMNFR